jgi:hypothetical protein
MTPLPLPGGRGAGALGRGGLAGAAGPEPRLLLEAAHFGATYDPVRPQLLSFQAILFDELPQSLGTNAHLSGGLGQKHQFVLHGLGLYPLDNSSTVLLAHTLGLLVNS